MECVRRHVWVHASSSAFGRGEGSPLRVLLAMKNKAAPPRDRALQGQKVPTNPNRNTERELPTLRHRHAVVAQLSHRALANLDLDQLLRETVLTVADVLAVDACLVLEGLP